MSASFAQMREYASQMRCNMTDAEKMMWQILRNNGAGVKFRRQHIIKDYIADFVCISKGLIIEVDGEYHDDVEQQEADALRSSALKAMGFTILRFKNDEILQDPQQIKETIQQYINNIPQ